jgi:DNA ligase 1
MLFRDFSDYLQRIEKLTSRNEISVVFADLFSNLEIDEVKNAVYMTLGRLLPKYTGLEFNMSTKMILKSLQGDMSQVLAKNFQDFGDIGEAVFHTLENANCLRMNLGINEVYEKLREIAEFGGKGSQDIKVKVLKKLLLDSSPLEAKYIARIITGSLRLGLSEKTILDSLSIFSVGNKSIKDEIERAYGVRSDIGLIAEIVKQNKDGDLLKRLNLLKISPTIPVASKLVEREKNPAKIFERIPESFVQPKLDGLRGQIHYIKDTNSMRLSSMQAKSQIPGELSLFQGSKTPDIKVEIFSRNMERMSDMYPEIVAYLSELDLEGVESFVLDSEMIGFNSETGEYLKFQDTIQRKRKHGVLQKSLDIPLKVMAFDLLYLNGEDLSARDLEHRLESLRALCKSIGKASNGKQTLVEMLETRKITNQLDLDSYFEENIAKGLEGIIVKEIGTIYEPGTRNFDWIKLKASSKKNMVDTIDAVVLGYYRGEGTRSKSGIGSILVGLYDNLQDKYCTVAKVGTGISDDLFVTMKEDFVDKQVVSKPDNYDIKKILEPDFYIRPEIVVEVEADEITRSKTHTACMDEQGNGLSMRFPRLKKWNRQDKNTDQATSPKEFEQMFEIG